MFCFSRKSNKSCKNRLKVPEREGFPPIMRFCARMVYKVAFYSALTWWKEAPLSGLGVKEIFHHGRVQESRVPEGRDSGLG